MLSPLAAWRAPANTGGFGRGLESLAYLARNEEKKDAVREFLLGYVNSHKKRVQLAALNGLGTLGDAKAIPALETFTAGAKDSPERGAAANSLTILRESRKPSVELGALRNEVLSLQKENRDLRKEFDDLKKKLDALLPGPAKTNKANAGSKTPSKTGK